MHKVFKALLVFGMLAVVNLSYAAEDIIIATNSNQPPYEMGGSGITYDLAKALNELQGDFNFQVKTMPAIRSKNGLESGSVHMLSMTNINWGYNEKGNKESVNLLQVQDKFFALKASAANGQDYFSDLSGHSKVVVNGFSYNIFSFEKDHAVLKEKYNAGTVKDEPTAIKMVLSGRSDMGISSSSTLGYFNTQQPDDYGKLIVSDISDSTYFRHFVVSAKSPISVDQLNELFNQLGETGRLDMIFGQYGLESQL